MTDGDAKITEEVSAAYQALPKETPPRELDECILQAARSKAKEERPSKKLGFPYQRYLPVAASLCLSVLIVSLFMHTEEFLPSGSESMESIQSIESVMSPNVAPAPAALRTQTQRAADENVVRTRSVLAERQALEEIVVADSRIAVTGNATLMAEDWLLEIQSLLLTDEAAAQEQISLFTQAYPDINVEAALGELE